MTTRLAACALLLIACVDAPADELTPEGGADGKADGSCPLVPARMTPQIAPPYRCAPVGLVSNTLMADVNTFWASEIQLCGCGPDYPDACEGATAYSGGYVYADPSFLDGLRVSGSDMPTSYVLAHEVGHEIQGYFDLVSPIEQYKELMADCLAGYYLGSLSCRGIATANDVRTTLATACVIADGTGDPVADLRTHGTCEQRASAVARGMDAYAQRLPPIAACQI